MKESDFNFDDLRRCIATHLERDCAEVSGQFRLVEDLGVDSLSMHALMIDIEEAGGRIPPPDALEGVTTVADLFAAVAGEAVP